MQKSTSHDELTPLADQAERDKVINGSENFFISATAGTGKSTLMCKKIISLLESREINSIKEIVAITYTHQASEDLRNKIEIHIHEKLKECTDQEDEIFFRSTIEKLHESMICTIHSFCIECLKKCALELELPLQFSILASTEESIYFFQGIFLEYLIQRKLIAPKANIQFIYKPEMQDEPSERLEILSHWKQIFTYYKGQMQNIQSIFYELYQMILQVDKFTMQDNFYIRNVTQLKEIEKKVFQEHKIKFLQLLKCYKATDNNPFYISLKTISENLDRPKTLRESKDYVPAIHTTKRGSKEHIQLNPSFGFREKEDILKTLRTYRKLFLGKPIELEDLSPEQKIYLESDCMKGYCILSSDTLEQEYLKYAYYAVTLDLTDYLQAKKRSLGVFDYQDLINMTYEATEQQNILNVMAQGFRYIFIDEYQDTDVKQTALFHRLRDNASIHLIRVGDQNQSIYSFRGASADTYSIEQKNVLPKEHSQLSVNMRSHVSILNFINILFTPPHSHSSLQNSDKKNHPQSKATKPSGKNLDYLAQHITFTILQPNHSLQSNYKDPDVCLTWLNEYEPKEKYQMQSVREMEAYWIANEIQKLVHQDKKNLTNTAILLRALSHVHIYEEILHQYDIPYYVVDHNKQDSLVPLVPLLHVITLLYNPDDTIALVGLLRSPFVGLSDDEIDQYNFTKKKNSSVAKDIADITKLPNFHLFERCLEKLLFLRTQGYYISLAELFTLVLDAFCVLDILHVYADNISLGKAIETIYDIAHNIDNTPDTALLTKLRNFHATLDQFLNGEYHSNSQRKDIDMRECIQIMTIHKAKGLEFDHVFIGDLQYDLLSQAKRTQSYFLNDGNNQYQFYLKGDIANYSLSKKPTPRQIHIQKTKEEMTRLFYVALTRAKSRLYIPLTPETSPKVTECYHNWIINTLKIRLANDIQINQESREDITFNDETSTLCLSTATLTYPKEKRLTTYLKESAFNTDLPQSPSYPTMKFVSATSLLKQQFIEESNSQYHKPEKIHLDTLTPDKKGIFYHQFFEEIDLTASVVDKEIIVRINNLYSTHHNFSDELIRTWKTYINSPLHKLIQYARILGKEVAFSTFLHNRDKPDSREIHAGYVDLILYLKNSHQINGLEYHSGIYLVDYKSNQQPDNQDIQSFIESLEIRYMPQMQFYQQALTKYYEKEIIHCLLYHTPSGKLRKVKGS